MVRRWWNSTTTTIGLTVVVAIVLGFSLRQTVNEGLTYLGLPRQQLSQPEDARLLAQLPGWITALLDVLDATPESARPDVIAAAQRSALHIRLMDAPLSDLMSRPEPEAALLRRRIEAVLTVPHPVIVADGHRSVEKDSSPDSTGTQTGVRVETGLKDGHWLLVESSLNLPSVVDPVAIEFSRVLFAAWLVVSILPGIVLAFLAARRLVKPMSELAAAVEQLGGTADAPFVSPRGPREVRALIEAFNRMRERLRRFNEDRTRMIAAMSHDLRTPLTRLRLRTELVQDDNQQPRMLAEIDNVIGMIESMLSFARDDARHEPRTLVDVSALTEDICLDAVDAGEPVTYSGPRGITISCRPTALRRAISNLIDNAVKYGNRAYVSLVPEPERVVLMVEDEGPGIPRSERERVFDPFYRIENSRDPNTGGVGLGLSVTRSIIWEDGGDIILGTRKGGGLSVRVELPTGAVSGRSDTKVVPSPEEATTPTPVDPHLQSSDQTDDRR